MITPTVKATLEEVIQKYFLPAVREELNQALEEEIQTFKMMMDKRLKQVAIETGGRLRIFAHNLPYKMATEIEVVVTLEEEKK